MSGFDCDDYYLEHCYMVRVPRAVTEPVSFFEIFGRRPAATEQEWAPEFVLRAVLPREKWDVVSAETRVEFNRRLKTDRKRSGKWIVGNNGVQRLFGKELLVLVWAVEQDDVTEDRIQVAVRNWLGLKPEERWWLYTMTAAATGYASQKGLGWRGALKHALTYGTDKDAFSFANIGERGTLPPQHNDGFVRKNDNQTRTAETATFKAVLGRLAFA